MNAAGSSALFQPSRHIMSPSTVLAVAIRFHLPASIARSVARLALRHILHRGTVLVAVKHCHLAVSFAQSVARLFPCPFGFIQVGSETLLSITTLTKSRLLIHQ